MPGLMDCVSYFVDPAKEDQNNRGMIRVLLVIDDYGELVYLQTLLKKIGFDVDGVQNQKKVDDLVLSFNPDLIVATSKGKRVNGLKVAERIKRIKGLPKIILLIPTAMSEKMQGFTFNNVDSFIESPVKAVDLLGNLARVVGLDGDQLIEKYRKMKQKLDPDNEADVHLIKNEEGIDESFEDESPRPRSSSSGAVSVNMSPSSITPEERSQRMKTMLKKLKQPKANGFPQDVVKHFNKKIRSEEQLEDTKDLEEERQAFVKAMFKKHSNRN